MAKYTVGDIFKGDYPISQYFANNPGYYAQYGFNGHEGVDFATPVGVEILAPFKRNIILQDQNDPKSGAYGNYIVVWDPDQKCVIWFCHLSENFVDFGKEYPKGAVLGKTGNTGKSSGPHVHVNFAETDANRNRLNTNNGFKGFLNILDSNLVQWQLGTEQTTIPVENQQSLIDQLRKERDDNWNLYAPFKDAGYDNIDKVKAEVKAKQDTIDNLNTQIAKLQSEQSVVVAQISSSNAQLLTLQSELEGLRKQSEEWIEKKKLYEQMESNYQKDKLTWEAFQQTTNRQIAQLKNTSFKTAKSSILFGELTRRFLRING